MNALSQEKVGAYLNAHCVAAVQKVATFTIAQGKQKQGGNVAAYFCTPDRQVLHAIAGPVDDAVFLREARWAIDVWEAAQLENLATVAERKVFFRQAHADRLLREHQLRFQPGSQPMSLAQILERNARLNLQGKVHLLLATVPLAPIESIYRPVFERILNEKISTNPVNVAGK